jgi:pimeloyl-ACP methyl ester carboxylesterase
MGLGGPMNWWDPALCTMLADRGFFVIRFDNRDTGRSTRIDGRINRRMLLGSFVGARRRTHPPYTLTNMADDAFGLLDSLRIDSAHVVGVSMGGMIAQTMAIARPERVRSLTSIMSTTGRRSVGWTDPRLLPMMLTGRAASAEEYVAASARLSGGTTVGVGATVEAGAVVDGSVLFDGAIIRAGAVVRRSAVGFGAVVGEDAVLEDAVVGDRARIGARVELLAGARVWPDVVVPDGAIRFSSDL